MSSPPPQQFRAGMLALQVDLDGARRTLRLRGELDLANADLLEAELGKALDDHLGQVVVDMRELSFIDSTGIAVLVAAMGRGSGQTELRFLPSEEPAVSRVLQLTGVDQRMLLPDDNEPDAVAAGAQAP